MTNARPSQSHETLFWRRLAHWGATRGPRWWVEYSPPVFGWAAALLVPGARHAVQRNLRRIRGEAPPGRDVREVLATFGSYASCLTDALSNDAPGGPPRFSSRIHGELWMRRALAHGRGVVVVTMHSAGWEAAGPMFAQHLGLDILIGMQAEADAAAQKIQDRARRVAGVAIAHVGADPFSSLPLLHHLRDGGAVALQVDRAPVGMRARDVQFLGEPTRMPEGALRLAQISGAPIVPVFSARLGFRHYLIEATPAIFLPRRATEEELDAAAQLVADRMGAFLGAHPTQWFNFR